VAVELPDTLDNFEDALNRPPDFGGWLCGVMGSSCDHSDRRACAQRLGPSPPTTTLPTMFCCGGWFSRSLPCRQLTHITHHSQLAANFRRPLSAQGSSSALSACKASTTAATSAGLTTTTPTTAAAQTGAAHVGAR